MAQTNSKNDHMNYLNQTKESTRPLAYMLQVDAHEACQVCGNTPNAINHPIRIHAENELRGLTRKQSRYPGDKYQMGSNLDAITTNYGAPYVCERNLTDKTFIDQANHNEWMEKLAKETDTWLKEHMNN